MDGLNATGRGLAPAGFEENKGQVRTTGGDPAPEVRYRLAQGGASIFLLERGIAYQFNRLHKPEGLEALERAARPDPAKRRELEALRGQTRLETYRMDMLLEGADPQARITAEGRSADATHYYNHDVLDVHSYARVTYHDVYPGIDWVLYTTEQGMKHDFVVRPGADPGLIRMRFVHHEELRVEADGSLTHGNRMGRFTEAPPVSYQEGRAIGTRFVLQGDVLRFALEGYDATKPLTIDPARLWGTYYGGENGAIGWPCAVDGSGNVYLAGSTFSATGIASGGHQNSLAGSEQDAFLVKFNAGGVRQWATYYGGDGNEAALSLATDPWGNVFLAGHTVSIGGIASGGHQNALGGNTDAFLVKFNAGGVRLWGTYYGGEGFDAAYACAADGSGNVYLAGHTIASHSGIASSGHQSASGGGLDGFLVKFSADGARLWGTYYGGAGADEAFSCAVDGSGCVYLAGYTTSADDIASGGFQNVLAGGYDGFLAKFDPYGIRLWATYYGGSNTDSAESCAVDGIGNVYLAGHTNSSTGIASDGHQNALAGSSDAFLVKFSSGGDRLWGTYYGGSGIESGLSCAVETSHHVFLAGYTNSITGIAFGGHQNDLAGGYDAFVVKFDAAGTRVWGTYYGGSADDFGETNAVDPGGNIHLGGYTASADGIASGGHQNALAGSIDAFLVKLQGSSISTGSIAGPLCAYYTEAVDVPFTTSAAFDPDNLFYAQLSDANGSFASPLTIGWLWGTGSGTITATIPISLPDGTGYRIRVLSTAPPVVGTNNGADLVLTHAIYHQDIDGDGWGSPYYYTYVGCDGTPPPGYVTNGGDCDDTDPSITVVGSACDADPGPGYLSGVLNSSCTCIPYDHQIFTGGVTGPLCAASLLLFDVPFIVSGDFNPGNHFIAQLSNSSGSFASPTVIGILPGTGSGTITASIPTATPSGSGYRIRVVSTDPAVSDGWDNGTNLVINTPTTYYPDLDGDGFGTPYYSVLSCTGGPNGYVTNNHDCNDFDAYITVVGTACDADPGPGYLPGELNAACDCIGTFTFSETVVLVFETGSAPEQLSWAIRDAATSSIVHSGTGASYPPNTLYFVTLSMPTNMCFKLSVTDAGDGAHGYRLLDAATLARIIDNDGNLGTGLSEMSGEESFCLPMGGSRLIYNSCDKYWWRSGEYVVAAPDPDVSAQYGVTNTTSGYEFWIYNPNGGYSFRRFRNHATSDGFGTDNAERACHMKLNNWAAANHVPEFDLHNVRVRARVAGVNKPWGPACRLVRNEALALCPPTKLLDIPGNRYISCGQSRQFVSSQRIHARPVSGANRYQWRFRIPAEGVEIIRSSNTYFLNLGWGASVAPPLVASKTYEVEVRASRDGGLSWCGTADPWGDVCLLTITSSSAMGHAQDPPGDLGIDEPRLSLWPNPNNGDELWVSLDGIAAELESVTAEVYDVNGRRVLGRVLPTQYGQLYTAIEVNGLAPGMYLMHLTAGEQRFAQRLVIER